MERFEKLYESILCHNKDEIPLYLSVPSAELTLFSHFHDEKKCILISDESYAGPHLILSSPDVHGNRTGYLNQEICKLNFYRTGVCRNYLALDADSMFIRDFYISDFMFSDSIPYTVFHQDKDLMMDPAYSRVFGKDRDKMIRKIWGFIGLPDTRYRTCHGFQNMNCEVLASLHNDFMNPRALTYGQLLQIAPLEFSWYNAWFQKCRKVEEYSVEPFFKCFHTRAQYFFAKLQFLSVQDIKTQYVGIVLQSNWNSNSSMIKYDRVYTFLFILHYLLFHFLLRRI